MSDSPNQHDLEHDVTPQENGTGHDPTPTPKKLNPRLWFGVLALLIGVGVLGWAGYVWATGDGGFDFRRFAFLGEEQTKLYAARGQVLFDGEILKSGHVEARPINQAGRVPDRIIGPIQNDGTFEFYTDFGTGLSKGIPEGRYKLMLMVYQPAQGMGPPDQILPDKYYDESLTPITVTVTSDPQKNHFELEEASDSPSKTKPTDKE